MAPKNPTEPRTGHGLARSLSNEQMTMIALGSALGTGLFLGSGEAIAIAGPAVIVCYAIGSLIAAIIGASAGEMAARFPVHGGFGTMAGRYLGPFGGYVTRWAYWASTVCVSGAELVAVATYLKFWWPQLPLWLGIAVFGVAILALNAWSVGSFGRVEAVLSGIKVLAVLAFIVIGLLLVFFGLPGHPADGVSRLGQDGGFLPHGPASIWLAMAVVMFSFGGVELISISAAEAKDPATSVRRAGKATMYRLSTFYILSLFVVVCLLPWQTAAGTGEDVASSPFVLVFSQVGVPVAAAVTNFIVLVAALSSANANVYAGARLLHSLSSQRMAPAFAGTTTRRGVPLRALVCSCVGILAVVVLALVTTDVFVIIMSVTMAFAVVVWIMILAAFIRFRTALGRSPGFAVIGGRATAALGILGLLAVFAALLVNPGMRVASLVAVGVFAVLGVIYLLRTRRVMLTDEEAFREAHEATAAHETVAGG